MDCHDYYVLYSLCNGLLGSGNITSSCSSIDCMVRCQATEGCPSFFYSVDDKLCQLSSTWHFSSNGLTPTSGYKYYMKPAGREIRYMVSVKTGDVYHGGTNSDVTIQFVGPKGTTKKLLMDDYRDNFERNMTEQFELRDIDVGPLTRIIVSQDNSTLDASWYLEHVTVKRYLSNEEKQEQVKIPEYEEYFFLCQQWLDAKRGDKQISRELTVEKNQTILSYR